MKNSLKYAILSIIAAFGSINCQLDELEEDIGLVGLLGIAAGGVCLFCCCVLLVVVYCLGGCPCGSSSDKLRNDTPDATDYSDANVTFGKPQYELTSSPPKKKQKPQTTGVQVSADLLPNDISELEKSTKDTKPDTETTSVTSSLLARSNVSRNPPKGSGESQLTKLAIPGGGSTVSNKKNNRLSVKDMAASGFLKPFQPVFKEGAEGSNKRLYSTQYEEPPLGNENAEEGQPKTGSKNQEDIKKKIAKIARGAGGGVYNTGMGTARLSTEIVDGFNLLREKKKMEAEEREKANALKASRKKEVHKSEPLPVPTKTTPPESQLSGKEKLKNFLNNTNEYQDLDDADF